MAVALLPSPSLAAPPDGPVLPRRRAPCSRPSRPLSSAIDEVVRPAAQVTALRAFDDQFESLAASFDPPHRKAVVEIQGGTQAVEARPEVGGGRWHIHHHFLTMRGCAILIVCSGQCPTRLANILARQAELNRPASGSITA